ncbi:MAG: PIG-L family deacetylase [Clostridia bacterium]|nr:PIG-L family deacetylase [Clostridia bacterium]
MILLRGEVVCLGSSVLVIAAHPDDEVLGCGGTMRRLTSEGTEVYCLILGEGVTSRDGNRDAVLRAKELDELRSTARRANGLLGVREVFFASLPDNRFDSVDLLDVVKIVEEHVSGLRPERVFTHGGGDLNPGFPDTHNE